MSLIQAVVFFLRQEIVFNQVPEPLRVEMSFCNPADHLNIAQSPRAFLYIGFQVVLAIVKFMMAGNLFFPFSGKEFSRRPDFFRPCHFGHGFKQRRITHKQSGFHEVCGYRNI